MSDLNLDFDEEILLEKTGNIICYSGNNNELPIEEFYLTNCHIIYVYKHKMAGVFIPKFETIVEKIPLSTIKTINGSVMVTQEKDFTHGRTLQIVYTNRPKEIFKFGSSKKEYETWTNTISEAVQNTIHVTHNRFTANYDQYTQPNTDWKVSTPHEKTAESNTEYNDANNPYSHSFCTVCGMKLDPGTKFCANCGTPVSDSNTTNKSEDPPQNETTNDNTNKHNKDNNKFEAESETSGEGENSFDSYSERKTVYEGSLHKCPSCGDALPAFISKCPSCGYEIRDAEGSKTIRNFAQKLESAKSDEQRNILIRSYPIANSRNDIFEFMILASTNIVNETNNSIINAWIVKAEQAYKKATLLLDNKSDLEKIQKLYNECQNVLTEHQLQERKSRTLKLIIRNSAILAGLIMIIISIFIDASNGNSSFTEMVAVIILIASAASLKKRDVGLIDFCMGILSGLIMIGLSFLLFNGSLIQLGGGIVLIIVVINFTKTLSRKNKNKG